MYIYMDRCAERSAICHGRHFVTCRKAMKTAEVTNSSSVLLQKLDSTQQDCQLVTF